MENNLKGGAEISTSNRVNKSQGKLQVFRKALAAVITKPVVTVLAKTGVTPNMVTWFGFIIIIGAAVLVGLGHPFAAGWVMLLSGFFDIIDGALARQTNQVTRFGGVLDSTLDRLSESAMLLGIMCFFLFHTNVEFLYWIVLFIGITMIFSFLVSYIRSRAEAAGIDCQVGIFTRAERVIILALGLLLSFNLALVIALVIIAILSIVTVIQRLIYTNQQAKKLSS